jgi:SOS-response transcriptional repressor LexA
MLPITNTATMPTKNDRPYLSARRKKYLTLLADFIAEKGWPPTYREWASAMGVQSSAVGLMVRKLEEDGMITQSPGAMRSLTITERGYHALGRVPHTPGQTGNVVSRIPLLNVSWRKDQKLEP